MFIKFANLSLDPIMDSGTALRIAKSESFNPLNIKFNLTGKIAGDHSDSNIKIGFSLKLECFVFYCQSKFSYKVMSFSSQFLSEVTGLLDELNRAKDTDELKDAIRIIAVERANQIKE